MNPDKSQPETTKTKTYNNNPFTLTVDGIKRVYKYAKPVAITLTVISIGLWLISNAGDPDEPTGTLATNNIDASMLGVALLVGLVAITGLLLAMLLIAGISDFTAAASAQNRKITMREAVDAIFDRFLAYLWLRILVLVKTVLWFLLLIVPGIYFSYRYKLAGVVFFAENKSAAASIDRSLKLTRGAWLTTFTSYWIINFPTAGLIQLLADTGTTSELYRQYDQTVAAELRQPKPHALSIILPIALVGLIALMLLAAVIFISANPDSLTMPPDTNFKFPTQTL